MSLFHVTLFKWVFVNYWQTRSEKFPTSNEIFFFSKIRSTHNGDVPDGPVAKTVNARSPRFDTWSGNYIPHGTTKSLYIIAKDPACCNQDLAQPNKYFLKKYSWWRNANSKSLKRINFLTLKLNVPFSKVPHMAYFIQWAS